MPSASKTTKTTKTTKTQIQKIEKIDYKALYEAQQQKNADLQMELEDSKKQIIELKTSVKGSSSRNTSSSSMSINTYRAMWLLIQSRQKLLFYIDNKAMMPSSIFYKESIDTTKELFDTALCEDLRFSINKGFWKYSTDFGKSGEQLGSLHNFGLAFLGFEGKLSKSHVSIEIFEEDSFNKYNKKGDIKYNNIATRRDLVIEFLRDNDKCSNIEEIKLFCSQIKNPIVTKEDKE